MRLATIEKKLEELRNDVIPWADRARLVHSLLSGASKVRPMTGASSELLHLLASDPKWEVRKEVANYLHFLNESDLTLFASKFCSDDNAFVKGAAEHALSRRRKGQIYEGRRIRGLDRTEEDLRMIEVRHGMKVANTVRDTAHRLYEGLVGASVHEMRSIVTAMKVNVENMERADDATIGHLAKTVAPRLTEQIGFLERLLEDMRSFTQNVPKARQTERLSSLVNEAARMVADEFFASHRDVSPVAIEINVPEDISVSVARVYMLFALRNLIKNAFESFMVDRETFQPGIVKIHASISDSGDVELTICDNGMGLSEAELSQVRQFIPGRTSKIYLGTGFGLPIARRNIIAHDGTLSLESTENAGSLVTVILPANGGSP